MGGHFAEGLVAVGPAVANHLWQSTAFAVAAWLVTLALRSNRARVRHAVWLAASLKFLVPFSLLIAAGNLLPHPKQAVAPVVYSAMDVVEEPFAEVAPPTVPVVHAPTLRERMVAVLPVFLGVVWVLGAGVVLAIFAVQWRKVRRALREAEPACEGREWEILRRVEAAAQKQTSGAKGSSYLSRLVSGLKSRPIEDGLIQAVRHCTIELRLLRERMEPGIFGVCGPVLVWPRELSARLDDAHIEAVLAHELAHVRRRDNLTAALHMLVEAVFWFHPLAWWMERQMVREREQACDEAVVALLGEGRGGEAEAGDAGCAPAYAETYAEALLKTCRFCVESPLACVAGVTGGELKQRVLGIVSGRALLRMTWPKKLLLGAMAAGAVAAPVVLGQAKAAQRMMLAAIKSAPQPLRAGARAMIEEIGTPAVGELAMAQVAAPPSVAAPSAASGSDDLALGPAFEVATIRPANRDDGRRWFGVRLDASGRLMGSAVGLGQLAMFAYVGPGQGTVKVDRTAPEWVNSEEFDINAKVDGVYMAGWDKMSDAQRAALVRPMLRRLLAERFKVKVRTEMQDMPVYALVQAKRGTKMKEAPAPPPPPQVEGDSMEAQVKRSMDAMKRMTSGQGVPPGQTACSATTCAGASVPVSRLLGMIRARGWVDRTVVDQTGLTGYYDFSFTVPTTNFAVNQPPGNDDDTPPFVQIGEELGLKFEPTKVPTKTYVIESAEKPSVDGAEVAPAARVVPAATAQQAGAQGQAAEN